MKEFVSLSFKNLKIVADWTEANRTHPLAQIYDNICISLGAFEEYLTEACTEVAPLWPGIPKWSTRPWPILYEAKTVGYECRDRVGRLILEVIKRSKRREA